MIALIFLFLPFSAFTKGLEPEDIWTHIRSQGGKSTIHTYFCDDTCDDANKLYLSIESGNEEWLKIAVRLLQDSDGVVTEDLLDSISKAMLKNPVAVLKLVDKNELLSAGHICLPLITLDVGWTDKKSLNYLNHLEKVLLHVNNTEVEQAKRKCLSQIIRERNTIKSK